MTKGQTTRGDIRLDRRRQKILENVVAKGTLVQRKLGGGRSGETAMHHFLGLEKTSTAYLMAPDVQLTANAARGRRIVAAQDTTEINFAGRDKRRKNLGPGGNGKTPGFFIHAIIAIDAEEEAVLGLVGAKIWTRALAPDSEADAASPQEGKTAETKNTEGGAGNAASGAEAAGGSEQSKEPKKSSKKDMRAFEEKESARWLEGCDNAAKVLQEAAQIIVVGDRENDIYPVFARKTNAVDLVVRAAQDRALAGRGRLFDASANWPVLGSHLVRVTPKKIGDKGRVAQVVVRSGSITLRRPQKERDKSLPKTLTLNMVEVVEPNPPEGIKPLTWRLLTTLPVSGLAQAQEVIGFYRLRWRIEQLFRTLKKDGLDLEAAQYEEASRLMKVAALGVVASCRIMQLVDARDGGGRPATDAIPAEHIEDVAAFGQTLEGRTARQKNPWQKGSLSWLSWIAARLGGWNCFGKKPGPKTMADGWKQIRAMLAMLDVVRGRVQPA